MIRIPDTLTETANRFEGLDPVEDLLRRNSFSRYPEPLTLEECLLRAYGITAPGHYQEWKGSELLVPTDTPQLVVVDETDKNSTQTSLHLVETTGYIDYVASITRAKFDAVDSRNGSLVSVPSTVIGAQWLHTNRHIQSLFNGGSGNNYSRSPLVLNGATVRLGTNTAGLCETASEATQVLCVHETRPHAEFPVTPVQDVQDVDHITESSGYSKSLFNIMKTLKFGITSIRPKARGARNEGARARHDRLPVFDKGILKIAGVDYSALTGSESGTLSAPTSLEVLACIDHLIGLNGKHRDR